MMPVMDGWVFCRRRWKSRTLREIPVILISSVDMSESNRPTGIDAFLPKPIIWIKFAGLAVRIAARKRSPILRKQFAALTTVGRYGVGVCMRGQRDTKVVPASEEERTSIVSSPSCRSPTSALSARRRS